MWKAIFPLYSHSDREQMFLRMDAVITDTDDHKRTIQTNKIIIPV